MRCENLHRVSPPPTHLLSQLLEILTPSSRDRQKGQRTFFRVFPRLSRRPPQAIINERSLRRDKNFVNYPLGYCSPTPSPFNPSPLAALLNPSPCSRDRKEDSPLSANCSSPLKTSHLQLFVSCKNVGNLEQCLPNPLHCEA